MSRLNLVVFIFLFGLYLAVQVSVSFGIFKEKSDKIRGYTDIYIIKVFEYGSDIVLSKFKILDEVEGLCSAKSKVNPRPDAFFCTAKNINFDPCFVDNRANNHTKVACMKSPWENEITIINIKGNLPAANASVNFYEADPWGVELEGNAYCLMTANAPHTAAMEFAGIETKSVCFTGKGMLSDMRIFKPIERSKVFWVGIVDVGDYMVHTKKINIAYY